MQHNLPPKIVTKRWIFLPVEVKGRELDAKLLLLHFALEKGFGVFLGRNGMNIGRDPFPRGIYFDKCLSNHKIAFHEHQVERLGNKLVSFDEEGLLYGSTDDYQSHRLSKQSINLSSLIFLWGNKQRALFEPYTSDKSKLVITGSPRIDLWQPPLTSLYSSEVTSISAKYGSFILVVSNWGFTTSEKERGIDPNLSYDDNPHSLIRASFLQLVERLSSEFPDQHIIVRPHPGEREDYWRRTATLFHNNVHVIRAGAIGPWIHAAQAVIHNNCTTGLETWMGGLTPIVYAPRLDRFPDYHRYALQINDLGVKCETQDAVVDTVKARFNEDKEPRSKRQESIINEYVFRSRNQLAVEQIVKHLDDLGVSEEPYRVPHYGALKKLRSATSRLKWRIRDMLGLSGMYTLEYTLGKNPGIDPTDIRDSLTRYSKHFKTNASSTRIRQISADTYCIYNESP